MIIMSFMGIDVKYMKKNNIFQTKRPQKKKKNETIRNWYIYID